MPAEWIQPVYDRTSLDILSGTSKGYLNAEDLQRIDGDIMYLSNLLGAAYTAADWTMESLPTVSQFQRMYLGLVRIVAKFYGYPNTPYTPRLPWNTWQKINDAEQILDDYYHMYTDYLSATQYTGDENICGIQIGVI